MTASSRAKILARGAVQGVGFRPFVHRLATELDLRGYVLNSGSGLTIEVEGERVSDFLSRFEKEKPPRAILQSMETALLDPVGYRNFEIRQSSDAGEKTAFILPDIATCADCLREIFDPADRRFRYPFTNCTNCGPRFSIIEALPYDRAHTSMRAFAMCAQCEDEYQEPGDRRFHAQPNACPLCGPQLQFWDSLGNLIAEKEAALQRAAGEIRAGRILALEGLGGFQLLVDARNEEAVVRLRALKHREEKPFALLFPSLEILRESCEVSELEERLLRSPAAPIVLLRSKEHALAASIAPRNPNLGAMLPSTPLHHLLLAELGAPVVATSGNLSDEPICIDPREALVRLRGLADFFLVHDRPIVRPIDDSIARIMAGRELILRRARGYAPLPVWLSEEMPAMLAVGAHLKNTVALSVGRNIFVSQHLGDLQTEPAYAAFCAATRDLPQLYDSKIGRIVSDLHPDYLSSKFAQETGLPNESIQHHWAHVAACLAENEISAPALGVAWDGAGLGLDGTIWGGEFLRAQATGFLRVAHLRTFPLPGGDAASKEPPRSALGLLYEMFGEQLWGKTALLRNFSAQEIRILRQMLRQKTNTPRTSSAGRLFDAVAGLTGLRQTNRFEGQAAMELEFACAEGVTDAYPFNLLGDSPAIIDWAPAIQALMEDMRTHQSIGEVAARFHNAMAEMIVAVAHRIGERKVVLSGGCFQNRYLTEHVISRLRAENFQPYWHQRIPPNDGGISLGQIVAADWARKVTAS